MKAYVSQDQAPAERSKYAILFTKCAVGSCIVCEPAELNKIQTSFRKWLAKHAGSDWKIVVRKNCDDGKSRVGRVK